jgi:hypothetical protein
VALVIEKSVAMRVLEAAAVCCIGAGDAARESTLAGLDLGIPGGDDAHCVVVADRRRIEVVVEPGCDLGALRGRLEALSRRDWEIVVLVPLTDVGAAHGVLRGTTCRLQPWWLDGATVQFGASEIP